MYREEFNVIVIHPHGLARDSNGNVILSPTDCDISGVTNTCNILKHNGVDCSVRTVEIKQIERAVTNSVAKA